MTTTTATTAAAPPDMHYSPADHSTDTFSIMEQLAVRLARIETRIAGTTTTTTTTTTSSSTPSLLPFLCAERNKDGNHNSILWQRLLQATSRIEANTQKLGEAMLLQQLEKELLSPPPSSSSTTTRTTSTSTTTTTSSSSSTAATSSTAAAIREVSLPPPPSGALLGLEEKTALVLSQEDDLKQILGQLKTIDDLQKYISGPFLEGTGKEEAALHKRLAALEVDFWDTEARTVTLAREMEGLLTTYDEIVGLLSQKCMEWETQLLALAAAAAAGKRQKGGKT